MAMKRRTTRGRATPNLALRLCHEAQGGQILASERVYFARRVAAYNIVGVKDGTG